MRKVYITVKAALVLQLDDGVEVSTVMNEMNYEFTFKDVPGVTLLDEEILDYDITDSK